MRLKILIPVVLALGVVSTAMFAMTVMAGDRGNPGGADSLHPDHSGMEDAANKIVGVPCSTGSHTKHLVSGTGEVTVTSHMHHATWYWYDSDADASPSPEDRVVKLACGDIAPHDNTDTSITSWGDYGTVGWNDNTDRFTFTGNNNTGFGRYTKLRLDYCNGLIGDGDAGAYYPFEGVPDLCDRYFFEAGQVRPYPMGGV